MSTAIRWTAPILATILTLFLAGAATADGPEVGVDAVVEGNGSAELADIDSCIEAAEGDTVEVDIYVQDVEQLLAWQMELRYDAAVVEVADRDVQYFLTTADEANILDGSAATPDGDGRYSLGAVNANDSSSGADGSGVLARVTFTAVGAGISELDLRSEDIDDDGTIDRGPYLNNVDAEAIGDDNGDTFSDGVVRNAAIAVGSDCGDADPVVTSGSSDDDFPFVMVGAAVAVAVLAVLGGGLLMMRKRQSSAAQS